MVRFLGLVVVGLAALIPSGLGDDKPLPIPGSVKSNFDNGQPMSEALDKGAKGGPSERYAFTLKAKTKFRALLECDSCLPRLVLQDSAGLVIKKASNEIAVDLSATLEAGSYALSASTVPDRQGAYVLGTSNTGEEIDAKIQVYRDVTGSYQSGSKTIKKSVIVKVGLESIVLVEPVDFKIFKSLKRSDIQSVEGATTNKTNVGAAIMWGPAVAGAQQQKWIRITAAEQNLALEVPSKTYQLLLAELERIAKR